MNTTLTRRQQEIFYYLRDHAADFEHPPTLEELCKAMGVTSRGSMHKHVQALVEAGLIEPLQGQHRGIRLANAETPDDGNTLPFLGAIAAGLPLEAIANPEYINVPEELKSAKPCFVLRVQGESMIEAGILDGDYVVIEKSDSARNGEIVVALVDDGEATLKRVEQKPGEVILHPANSTMTALRYPPAQVRIQGRLVGLFRRY